MSPPNDLAVFHQYRPLLFSIAYRMLGSVTDAEDILQETFLRWQQSPRDDLRSPRSFLVTITSRLCINYLQSARSRREEYVGQWLPEPIVTGSGSNPDELLAVDESLSMAFLVLLERLSPIERAVFLLREVFDYEYAEIAAFLNQTEANCRQILSRARQHVSQNKPRFETSGREQNELLRNFLQAVETGDLEGLFALLAPQVTLHADGGGKGLAVPNVVRGADNVARGVLGSFRKLLPPTLTRRLVLLNGEAGLVNFLDGRPHSVLIPATSEGRIHAIYVITNPEKLRHLPPLSEIPE
jgi:RNA polymerase sigma-70 factor (ECF subfamily)